ncbi:PRC-barrel domain-containing protein [Microvirga sp. 2YAF29]|uniref:PRC-barrel domain-containing protein n=1 Tax=Microvirga sp. 2YAF29 TaxID=3233031 RepID=UPI003F9E91A5
MKMLAMTAAFLGTTLLASGAMAQTAPATPSAPGAGTTGSSQFITQLSPGTMLLSEFMDLDVIGPDNKDIGDVEDVILSRDGKVAAVVIEVDKGIGDRTVALPMASFQLVPDASTTGSVQNSSNTASALRDAADMNLKIDMTVEQLKAAPEFDHND